MNILDTILDHKRKEVEESRAKIPLEEIKQRALQVPQPRPFVKSLRSVELAVIAEIKKASPSRGVLLTDFDHVSLAKEYEQGGAQVLSVLTDRAFFQGDPSFIGDIKNVVKLPILRKDFIIDEYQVYESKAIGADAILLIVKALNKDTMKRLYDCAKSAGLSVLVETHTRDEIEIANGIKAEIIGINNRDLSTFDVSLERSLSLHGAIHTDAITVSESGIKSASDVKTLKRAGFHAILVGEGLVVKSNRVNALQELIQI